MKLGRVLNCVFQFVVDSPKVLTSCSVLPAQKKGLRGCVPLHASVMCREGWKHPLRIEEIRQAAENHEPWAVKACRLCLH